MTEITRRLKLRIPQDASSDSRYNLQRIDDWAGALQLGEDGTLTIATRDAITILPDAKAAGGSGENGVLNFGTSDSNVNVTFYSETVSFQKGLTLKNQADGNEFNLSLVFNSSSSTAPRILTLNTLDGDRSVTLGGNLVTGGNISTEGAVSVLGAYPLSLTLTADTNLTLPETGVLVTETSTSSLTNKTIDATQNSILNLTKSDVGLPDVDNTADSQKPVSVAQAAADAAVQSFSIQRANHTGTQDLVTTTVGILPISRGGTGETTSSASLNALLPSQSGNVGKVLITDGTNAGWVLPTLGTTQTYTYQWDVGFTRLITHPIGTQNVDVTVRDEDGNLVFCEVNILSTTQLILTSSEEPTGIWTVLVQGAP